MTALICVVLGLVLLGLCVVRTSSLRSRQEEQLDLTPDRSTHKSVSEVLDEDEPELVHWES